MKNPIRFAVLGAARIAHKLAPHMQASPASELVGVASRSADKSRKFAAQYSIPKTWPDYRAALDDPDVDAVYIPLPPSLHREWTIKAAEAGKHILCEKPLASTADEVDEMIEACLQHNVVLLDGTMWYHTARAAAIRNFVNSSEPGEIRQITSAFTFRWDSWPMQDFRMHREYGGGSLLDLGWYCVGASLWLQDELPQRVFAKASWHNDVDVRLNGFMEFSNNTTATIESGFDTVRRCWIEVAGTQKALVCDDFTRSRNPDKPRFWLHEPDGESKQQVYPDKPQEQAMIEAFCNLIRQQQYDHPWLDLSLKTQFVCETLDESARTQSIVELEIA